MSTVDPISNIPAHQSTIALLQRLKPKSKNWDDFLLSAFEDFLSSEKVGELERREKTERGSTFTEVEKRHPGEEEGTDICPIPLLPLGRRSSGSPSLLKGNWMDCHPK